MSEPENFVTRWSRRKLKPAGKNAPPEQPATQGADANQAAAAAAPEFDVSKLPAIESIGANSDISAFLQAGVPSSLRHAALRRVWVTDPAIRDFKGLAELDWDFTAPEGVPGFGALDPQLDIKKLVAEIFRDAEPEIKSPAEPTTPLPSPEQAAQLPGQSDAAAGVPAASEPLTAEPQSVVAPKEKSLLQRDENIAAQHDDSKKEPAAMRVRRHGSAMPQ